MKTGKELNISDKWLENTIVNKETGEHYLNCSPNSLLKEYVDNFQYHENHKEQIQKLINYTVVTFIKTDKVKNMMNNVRRWKYTNRTINEFKKVFPSVSFNTKSFDRMKDELIDMLFN